MKTKIGIVLSGGGARAHLGILKALEEFGMCPLTFQEPAQER
jgi:predicted acylesterase/phospholipase RssA